MFERWVKKESAIYWWLNGLLPSAAIGIGLGLLMNAGREHFRLIPAVAGGAFIGICCMTCVWVLQTLLMERIKRLPALSANIVRGLMYMAGGSIGFLIGLIFSLRLFWGLPFRVILREINFLPLLGVASVIALMIGGALYTFHELKRRLEESVVRLKESEFAEKELEIARSIQSRLLPPPESEGVGYRVAARNLAARYVAGDFFDVFAMADGSVGFVVADVAGKGVGASLIMASVKAILPLLAAGKSVSQTLTELNTKLARELGKREFVALAYAKLDTQTGELELSNGGLPEPYVLRAGAAATPMITPGPHLPLGVRAKVQYESSKTRLGIGDRLMMFSDGLPEATVAPGEPLGYEELGLLVSADGTQSPGVWLDTLFALIRSRTSEVLEDDWTALVVERT